MKSLLKKYILEEPAFRSVLVLFRAKDEPDTVQLKSYRNIPIAEMKLVFPEKRVASKVRMVFRNIISSITIFLVIFQTTSSTTAVKILSQLPGANYRWIQVRTIPSLSPSVCPQLT
jgi:hypothetical protein